MPGLEPAAFQALLCYTLRATQEKRCEPLLLFFVASFEPRSSASPQNAKSFLLVSCVL